MMLALWAMPLMAQEGTYMQARQAAIAGRTEEAVQLYCSLGEYKDAARKCAELRGGLANLSNRNEGNFQAGVKAFNARKFEQARYYFNEVTGPRYDLAQQFLNIRIPEAERTPPPPPKKVATKGEPKKDAKVEPPAPVAPEIETTLAAAVREYYSAKFEDAEKHFQAYLDSNGAKRGICQFYLGASRLTRFYLGGTRNEDSKLFVDAKTAFRAAAKTEGFRLPEQYMSPKILEVYKGVTQ